VHQRKGRIPAWDDYDSFNPATLRVGQEVNLNLKAQAVLNLMNGLSACYRVYEEECGVPLGDNEYAVLPDRDAKRIMKLLEQPGVLQTLATESGPELLGKMATLCAAAPRMDDVVDALARIDTEDLGRLVQFVRAAELVAVLKVWRENRENASEEFWQKELTDRSWILSQVFANSMVIVAAKAYVGGKTLHNSLGQIADFLYKNKFTANVGIVEIKTPVAELVRRTEYRTEVHAISGELAGAISQVLQQRDSLQKEFYALVHRGGDAIEALNPRCVIVAGCLSELTPEQVRSLELVRGQLGNLQVVTFDELFASVEAMLKLLGVDPMEEDDFPF